VLFDAIFLTLFFLTWALLGGVAWLAWSLRRTAVGAIWALPVALLGGAGGGAAVPLAGLDDGLGIGVSMLAALAAGVVATWAAFATWDGYDLGRRFARFAVHPAAVRRRGTRLWPDAEGRDLLARVAAPPRPPRRAPERHPVAGGRRTASIDSEARGAGGPDRDAGRPA